MTPEQRRIIYGSDSGEDLAEERAEILRDIRKIRDELIEDRATYRARLARLDDVMTANLNSMNATTSSMAQSQIEAAAKASGAVMRVHMDELADSVARGTEIAMRAAEDRLDKQLDMIADIMAKRKAPAVTAPVDVHLGDSMAVFGRMLVDAAARMEPMDATPIAAAITTVGADFASAQRQLADAFNNLANAIQNRPKRRHQLKYDNEGRLTSIETLDA